MSSDRSPSSQTPHSGDPIGPSLDSISEVEFGDKRELHPTDLGTQPPTPNPQPPNPHPPPWFAYIVPVVVFAFISWLESLFPNHYVSIYIAKALAITIALVVFRSSARDYVVEKKPLLTGLVVGLAVFAEWVLIDKYVPYPHAGSRVGFNPFTALPDTGERVLFLITRFYGLVLMVPFMEELFWRSFLLRFLTDSKWHDLPMDRFSWGAFMFVTAGFAAAHPEWLPAVICGAAYALLLRQSRSLFACLVAHSVTNLSLGVYIVTTGTWKLW